MAGIHIHPHDVLDEGIQQILEMINRIPEVTHIFPQVNTIFERNPNPIGILPRNRKRPVVFGNGKLYIPGLNQQRDLRLIVSEEISEENDPFSHIVEHINPEKYKVVPWVNVLNGAFKGANPVVTFRGTLINDWLCPNSNDVVNFWVDIFRFIDSKYGYKEFMLDRIRYPDWSGTQIIPEAIFTCFCPTCMQLMEQSNIDVHALKTIMDHICHSLNEGDYRAAVKLLKENDLINHWIRFRRDSISKLLEKMVGALQDYHFWIDLWPPSYAWILGQNYSEITSLVKTLKHFPYHKLGGGADVQGLIEFFADDPKQQEECFQAFLNLFDLSYEISYQSFKENGYPLSYIYDENQKVSEKSMEGTVIYSGIQMWNIDTDDFLTALKTAKKSAADDVIYYCYGWAESKYFDALENLK